MEPFFYDLNRSEEIKGTTPKLNVYLQERIRKNNKVAQLTCCTGQVEPAARDNTSMTAWKNKRIAFSTMFVLFI